MTVVNAGLWNISASYLKQNLIWSNLRHLEESKGRVSAYPHRRCKGCPAGTWSWL